MAIKYPGSDDSAITGGLAGILAATAFGGPVGAAIGIGAGLLSERMHRSELDVLADDYDAVQSYGSSIQDSIKATAPFVQQYAKDDPSYMEQLTSISEDAARSQQLAQHYDPQIRAAGLQQLTNVGARMDALHNDLQDRTQTLTDAVTAQEGKMRDHFQTEFEGAQAKARDGNALADQAMTMVNNDKAKGWTGDPETKAILLKVMGVGSREVNMDAVGASLGIPGIGINMDFNSFKPSYDQAVKIIEAYRQNVVKSSSDYAAQVAQLAHQNGFGFEADKDGKVTVRNIGSVVQNFLQVKPTSGGGPANDKPPPEDPIQNPAIARSPLGKLINKAAEGAGNVDLRPPPSGLTPEAMQTFNNNVNTANDAAAKIGAEASAATKAWINKHVRRNGGRNAPQLQRPTN
jgi:hypothetical protein